MAEILYHAAGGMFAKTALTPAFGTKPGVLAPILWGAVAAVGAALTWFGVVPLPVGLGAITGCVVVASATLARRSQQAERRADLHALAMSIGGDGTWDYDLRAGTISYDDRCAQMLGYDRGHVADRLSAWGKLVHPEDLPHARSALDDYLDGETDAYEVTVRLRDVRGCWRHILDRGRIVERDEAGKPTRVVGIHRDLGATQAGKNRITLPGLDDDDEHDTITEPLDAAAETKPNPVADAVEPGPSDPTVVTVGASQLLFDRLQAQLDGMTHQPARRLGREAEQAAELVRRIRRLEAWRQPSIELVPLAAIVDAFTGPKVEIALDLPIADADPVLLFEVISLVMDALADTKPRATQIDGLEAPSEPHVALSFRVANVDRLNPAKRPLELARGLLAPMRGSLHLQPSRIVVELPRPQY